MSPSHHSKKKDNCRKLELSSPASDCSQYFFFSWLDFWACFVYNIMQRNIKKLKARKQVDMATWWRHHHFSIACSASASMAQEWQAVMILTTCYKFKLQNTRPPLCIEWHLIIKMLQETFVFLPVLAPFPQAHPNLQCYHDIPAIRFTKLHFLGLGF